MQALETEGLQAEANEIIKYANFGRGVKELKTIEILKEKIVYLKKKRNKAKEIAKINCIIAQLEAMSTMKPFFNSKNYPDLSMYSKSKCVDVGKEIFNKTRKRLSDSKKYTFVPPEMLRDRISARLPEGRKHLADAFMDTLFGVINNNRLTSCGILVNDVSNRIVKLSNDTYDYDFLQRIIEIAEARLAHETAPGTKYKPIQKKEAVQNE